MADAAQFLGIGLIGQKFMGRAHSNAFRQVGPFCGPPLLPRLECVAGRDAGELAAFATRFGWRRTTTRWQDLIGDPAVELLDVATPNHLHAEPAILALGAGQHVLVEKPLAHTLEDARALRDAARSAAAKGVHAYVWFNYRRCPAIGLAWNLLREGRLGAIRHVRAHYLQSWGGPDTPASWRFRRDLAGSGAHGDLNAHSIDLARFLLGEEIEVVHGAVARTFHPLRRNPDGGPNLPSDVDDALAFTATFTGGAIGTFEASRVAGPHLNRNTIEINGDLGSLRFDFEEMNLLQLWDAADGAREGGWRRIVATEAGAHPWMEHWWPPAHPIGYEHTFTNLVADVLGALSGRAPVVPLADVADAFETQRVLEAALRAAAEGRAVPLADVN